MIAISLEYIIVTALFHFGAGTAFVGVGSNIFAVTLTKEIINNLESINERGISEKNLPLTVLQLSESIRLYSMLKQLSHTPNDQKGFFIQYLFITNYRLISDFMEIYQPQFMLICTWSLCAICGVMLLTQIQLVHIRFYSLIFGDIFLNVFSFRLFICSKNSFRWRYYC